MNSPPSKVPNNKKSKRLNKKKKPRNPAKKGDVCGDLAWLPCHPNDLELQELRKPRVELRKLPRRRLQAAAEIVATQGRRTRPFIDNFQRVDEDVPSR